MVVIYMVHVGTYCLHISFLPALSNSPSYSKGLRDPPQSPETNTIPLDYPRTRALQLPTGRYHLYTFRGCECLWFGATHPPFFSEGIGHRASIMVIITVIVLLVFNRPAFLKHGICHVFKPQTKQC